MSRVRLRDEHKIELEKCQNYVKSLETEERKTIVKLTECQTESKAKQKFERESKGILKLEKDNVTCHTEKKNLNEKFAKCEEDHVSCQKIRETLRDEYTTLNEDYTKCDTRYKARMKNENKEDEQENNILCCLKTMIKIIRTLENITSVKKENKCKDKKKCEEKAKQSAVG